MDDSGLSNAKFGTLSNVPLRDGWAHEAREFTPWLAKNLDLLEQVLQLRLELVAVEQQVGIFSADILCKSPDSDHFILIENQIERTDHSHLGQALTYAAGLDAVTIVWIAGRFADEHRACLDWLNRITKEGVNFYGIEIELWKIGNSPLAPRLNLVSNPNQFSKQVADASEKLALTKTQEVQRRYWEAFARALMASGSPIKATKALTDNYMTLSPFNVTGIGINVYTRKRPASIGVALYLTTGAAPSRYEKLVTRREDIEEHLGKLGWHISREGWTAYCTDERNDLDPFDESSWQEQHQWLIERTKAFYEYFKSVVPDLKSP